MLYLFYGDNIVESRQKYIDLKNKYLTQEYKSIVISSDNLDEIDQWLYERQSLFSDKKVFLSENIFKDKQAFKKLLVFDNQKGIDLVDWGSYKYVTKIKNRFK